MEKFQSVLMSIGNWAGENKYLSTIKDAFQEFMPFTIIGAIGILWSNVLVNSSTGLGSIFKPIMALEFLNPAFNALNFATISCISASIAYLIGQGIAEKNKLNPTFGGLIALASLISVSETSHTVMNGEEVIETLQGVFSGTLGATGLFTAMIISIVVVEIFTVFYKIDALKIKLPEQVPPQISRSFEYLIPGFIAMAILSLIGLGVQMTTGAYLNDLIFNMIQKPLLGIGGSLPGIMAFSLIISLFWSVGLHGDNMVSGVFQPIVIALITENSDAVLAGKAATNIVNWSWYRVFSCTGGTGMALGLALAILIVGKRDDNRAIATLSIVPNMFNIMETEAFGLPIVLNPIIIIPFVLAPLASLLIGYVLTAIGFCPVMYINAPWTMPPFLYAFIAAGGSITAGIAQLIAVAASTLIYIPFIKIYEKQQNAQDAEA